MHLDFVAKASVGIAFTGWGCRVELQLLPKLPVTPREWTVSFASGRDKDAGVAAISNPAEGATPLAYERFAALTSDKLYYITIQ